MKKTLIAFVVVLTTIVTASAQEFKVGAKAGFLLSNTSELKHSETNIVGNVETTKYNTVFKPGFHFGGFIEYGFNKHWFVEAGLDYAFQGAKINSYQVIREDKNGNVFSDVKTDLKDSSKWNTQQFNIPIWIKYDISGFRPKVGVNLGFLTKAEVKVEEQQFAIHSFKYSLDPNKKFDIGLGIGAEYNLPFGLFFDATFNLGLTELSTKQKQIFEEGEELLPFPSLTFKNRIIQVGVGYKF
ncbi:hypothetical protein RCZ04_07660 [Capnocytophaga sp. HP1101]